MDITSYILGFAKGKAQGGSGGGTDSGGTENSVEVKPLTVFENGTYTAPEGEAYSPVTVSVASDSGDLLQGYELVEILAPTQLSLTQGGAWIAPNEIGAVIATEDDVKNGNVEVFDTDESGLVILNHRELYGVCASSRQTSGILIVDKYTCLSVAGGVGNVSLVTAWRPIKSTTDTWKIEENFKNFGKSNEPFFIVGNTNHGLQYISDQSEPCTITVQIYKIKRKSYTVDFYDEDTLINSEQVLYGKSSKYSTKPTKEGYVFKGWNPEPVDVTSNMTCYATWEVDFATAEWSKISEVSQLEEASNVFNIGDTRTITLTWEDGTTEDVELQIAAIGIDKEANTSKPVVTLITKNLISKTSKWAKNYSNRTQYNYHSSGCLFKDFLTETVFNALPEDLRLVLRQTKLNNTTFYILPPRNECIGFAISATPTVTKGQTYPIFTEDNASRIKTLNGVAHNWATYNNPVFCYPDYCKVVVEENGSLSTTLTSPSTTSAEIGACFLLFI